MDQLNGKKKNLLKVNGQLSSANDSELQQIAQNQGQLLPTSPLAAQMMGASKDSAKMAGTAAQKQAATSINVAGTPNLQTVQRTQQARTEMTSPEQQQYVKSQELMESGSIGDSIQKLVQSYIPKQAAAIAGTTPKYQLKVDALPSLTPEQKAALDGLLANPTKEAAAAIMPLLQGTGIVNPLSLIQPVSSIEYSAGQIAKQMQPITVGDLFNKPAGPPVPKGPPGTTPATSQLMANGNPPPPSTFVGTDGQVYPNYNYKINLPGSAGTSSQQNQLGPTNSVAYPLPTINNTISPAGGQLMGGTGEASALQPIDAEQVVQSGVTPEQLSSLLKVTPEQLSAMPIEELQKRIDKIQKEEFTRTKKLRDIVTSPDASGADKESARRQLADLGASGVVANEADVERLNDTIQSSDEIQVGSESVPLKDFLTSDKFSSIIKEYVEGTPEQQAKLGAQLGPEFVQFINDHKTALEEATSSLNATQKSATDTMAANKDLAKVKDGSSFSKGFMDKILPGWDGNFGEALQKPTILKTMDLMDEKQAGDFKIALEKASPTALEKLKSMTLQQLQAEGLLDPTKLNKYIASTQLLDTMNALNPDNPEQAAQITNTILQNLGMPIEEVNKQLAMAKETGLQTPLSKKLDTNKDGKLDDPADLKSIQDFSEFVGDDKSLTDTHNEMFNTLSKYLGDGDFSLPDIQDLLKIPVVKNDPTGNLRRQKDEESRPQRGATLEKLITSGNPAAMEYIKDDPVMAGTLILSQSMLPDVVEFNRGKDLQLLDNATVDKWKKELQRVASMSPDMKPAVSYYEGVIEGMEERRVEAFLPRIDKNLSARLTKLLTFKNNGGDPFMQFLSKKLKDSPTRRVSKDFFRTPVGKDFLENAQREFIKKTYIK